jgi:hypothetical protein
MGDDIADVRERLGEIGATAKAAHARIDNLEKNLREDLKSIFDKLDDVSANMNRGKGWGAAFLFLAGICGAGLSAWFMTIFKGGQ